MLIKHSFCMLSTSMSDGDGGPQEMAAADKVVHIEKPAILLEEILRILEMGWL